MQQSDAEKERVRKILDMLNLMYPGARCALNFTTPFELLVATILSAQCTDKRVNEITSGLFQICKTPEDVLALGVDGLAEKIRGLGLFRNKSKHIFAAAEMILTRFGGRVPKTREELMQLPGVGRKTANVVLANAFGYPAIPVDTHVHRVSNRLGLVRAKTPEAVEQQLMKVAPKDRWIDLHHQLIRHGRTLCTARKPQCSDCPLLPYCPTGAKNELGE